MDESAAEPRPYQRVYTDLRARIQRGELVPGTQLPSQPTLAAEYGVALLTVRHAIELLRRGGYLSVEHGRGTFVAQPRPSTTVLIVDDDPSVRSILAEHAQFGGHRVVEAANGAEALEVLSREPVSLVFTDLRMPRMDGVELLKRARPRWPSTVFVVISGYSDDLEELYNSDTFPVTVIPKPFRAEQVRRALGLIHRPASGTSAPSADGVPSDAIIDTAAPGRVNVLVVDDDAYHRAMLAELLRLNGYRVREAPDGSSALEAVDEEVFTHIFLDFRMPGLAGDEVARLIRERDDQVVIIFLSAYPQDALRSRVSAGLVGPVAVLPKPFEPADILAALRMSLAPTERLEVPGS
ncbi:MAG TPA: response regulator [Chloroflexota bacterium]|nr:response regulator [Chloroflexota bacterium]